MLPKTSFLIPLLDRQWKKNLTDSKCLRDFNVKNAILLLDEDALNAFSKTGTGSLLLVKS